MDDRTRYHVTLVDGIEFEAVSDGVGNLIIDDDIAEEAFEKDNLKTVIIQEGETEPYMLNNQINRCYIPYGDGKVMIRLDSMTETEKLREENLALQAQNDMLTECILEMSEIIYGE